MRNVNQWSFRLIEEEKRAKSSMFVTLTYDTKYVPITAKGFMTLDYSDVQKFIKRLRKRHQDKNYPVKYLCVGEYGTKKNRPHYHLIMFNATQEDISDTWMVNGDPIGSIYIGNVSGASVAYTLKYMMKEGKIPMHANDDRVPEFRRMSKGLGKNYLTEEMIKYHRKDEITFVASGKNKIAMPRYFKQKIWNRLELDLMNLKNEGDLQLRQDQKANQYERENQKIYEDGKRKESTIKSKRAVENSNRRE